MKTLKLTETQACYLYNLLAETLEKDKSFATQEIYMEDVKKKLSTIVWG